MSKRIFDKEQIATLSQNHNVARCSGKSISYRKDFKILAIRKYQSGLPPCEIFKQARFDLRMIGRKTPKECLHRWLKIFRQKGQMGLEIDGRGKHIFGGRSKNFAKLSDKEKMDRLEAEVAYLKEENHFLVKLRKERLNYGHSKNITS